MVFSSENVHSQVFIIHDPGSDNQQINLFKAPRACEIVSANIAVQTAQNAGTAGEFELQNWDTAGTAIKATGGTIAAALGGTASPLSANTPSAYTLTEGTLASGEWVVLDYQETTDWIENTVTIQIDYILGVGANA